jgi:hypothetical protein
MQDSKARFNADLSKLVELGEKMIADLYIHASEREGIQLKKQTQAKKLVKGSFSSNYQRWYTEAQAVVAQLIPARLDEFNMLYRADSRRKTFDVSTYSIQDWVTGVRARKNQYTGELPFDDLGVVIMRFQTQLEILKAARARFESSLLEIRQLLQADLFDSELDAARELLAKGFLRGAGGIAGVVLESHLAQVAVDHSIPLRKKHPSISDLNDALKQGQVIEVPSWRAIQRLADLRNLCDHRKKREPTQDEIQELIDGVDKLTKTLS